MEKIKNSLPIQIFIALALGIVAGLIFLAAGAADFTTEYIKPFGTIFLNLLKFIVVPIVITSIVQGVVSLSDIKKVSTIGLRTIIYYFCTTAFAITIGLIFANLFKGTYKVLQTSDLAYEAAEPTKFMDTIVNIFPSNLFQPMVESSMLQVIVISLFVGLGIIIAGDKGLPFK
ncbi:MAG: dicarboxylate/amino acid:cation symporter, partial [Mogibacterium sp.]|nr:dicarboxylate/amino acid:cation symporter [Mogibacterium sp.]